MLMAPTGQPAEASRAQASSSGGTGSAVTSAQSAPIRKTAGQVSAQIPQAVQVELSTIALNGPSPAGLGPLVRTLRYLPVFPPADPPGRYSLATETKMSSRRTPTPLRSGTKRTGLHLMLTPS
jgi:hypothetical protein